MQRKKIKLTKKKKKKELADYKEAEREVKKQQKQKEIVAQTQKPKSVKTSIEKLPDDQLSLFKEQLPKQADTNTKISLKDKKTGAKQLRLMPYRLWVYGVLVKLRDETLLKFGETRNEHEEGAIRYAAGETVGKIKGRVGGDPKRELLNNIPKNTINSSKNIQVLFVEEVTDYAQSIDPGYVIPFVKDGKETLLKGFDNYMRKRMPVSKDFEIYTNDWGESSKEVHIEDINQSDDEIREKWVKDIHKLMNTPYVPPQKEYTAREFHQETSKKISSGKSDKFLIAAATGAGKELATLESLIRIQQTRKELFNEHTIHVACATIPITVLELFEELSQVATIQMNSSLVDFSKIKPYCTATYKNGYFDQLTDNAQIWFQKNVTVVDKVSKIGTHDLDKEVPVLFGSFQDIGLKASTGDPNERYKALKNRIGILSVGEAHQFLSKMSNKLWSSIKKKYNFKFFLAITGTPYDFIFNPTSALYFEPEERALFTRNDLYEQKKNNPKGPFAKYPTMNYYQINIGDVVQEMKKDPRWQGDEHGFTYKKFFEFDKKNNKFKYEAAIVKFFERLFSTEPDKFTGQIDDLSINSAPNLCDYAKRHVIVALPTGKKGIGVSEYIPKLDKLIENSKVGQDYTSLTAFEDDLGKVKKIIDENKKPTIMLTCRALLTGTNIPAWGSLILLRPIGNSIKFFEQATGRIGRAHEDKPNVGIFLGDLDNAVNLHVSVDEKISLANKDSMPYDFIKRRTFNNYNFFGSKDGKWEKFELPDLNAALERVSGEVDYRYSLCLNNPEMPKDFNLEFLWKDPSGKERVQITDQGAGKRKNEEDEEKHRQLKIEYDEAKDKEKWYKNMLKTHISKIIIICLLKNIPTIEKFAEELNEAKEKGDNELFDMIGKGAELVPYYINNEKQIDIKYIDRWLSRIKEHSSDDPGKEGMEKRHFTVNNKIDLNKLSPSLIFDPLSISEEICNKLDNRLKSANNILIFEKNGSFTRTIIEKIGKENVNKLTIVVIDPICENIINYIITGKNTKLNNIKYIKDIEDLLTMKKFEFDVIVGNPPYQTPGAEKGQGQLYIRFIKNSIEILPPNGILAYVSPPTFLKDKIDIIGNNQIEYLNFNAGKHFKQGSSFCYFILRKKEKDGDTIVERGNKQFNVMLDYKKLIPVGNMHPVSFSVVDKIYSKNQRTFKFTRDAHPFPIDAIFVRRQNRNPYFHALKTYKGFTKKVKISADYTMKEDADNGIALLNSKLYKFLYKCYGTSPFITLGFINNVPFPKEDFKNMSDKEIFEYFGISPKEQEYINSVVK